MIHIDASIPSGRITVLSADNPADIRLEIPTDANSFYRGWYYFRSSGVRGQKCTYRLMNAGGFPDRPGFENPWMDTGPLASYDGIRWFRVPATFDGKVYSFEHQAESDICYYAPFAPYPAERDQKLIASLQGSPLVRVRTLGHSAQGRPIDLLTVGVESSEKKACWVIARQHPSETQGGFFIEGMLERLLDSNDPVARTLLEKATFHIVPNMNPDGSANGFFRTNTLGVDLNREWGAPSLDRSPEVCVVRGAMEQIGVDFCIDCHADPGLSCNFVWPSQNVPTWHAGRASQFDHFERAWAAASPEYGYGEPYPGGVPENADLSMAWNWVGNRFPDSLSVLLEQPYKDTRRAPVPETGWSPQRAARFGATFLNGLHGVVDHLRSQAEA
ncbi:carboxypeptidase family protein [Variovorax sp. Sphag1AA]|uniref:M14 family metallopeptidase n=1 Tax=Variovorax sp. Sphag1AA TaxID=2587027 RepID=UPI0016173841|nr:carboxypeptidase family protein [Variovorax sp. Sphag1AA]MBB3182253.1 murein tripeptide amidase MpaA [Variovorax sp. Sphag1AA]